MKRPPARYIVMNHGGEWKINLDNRYYGPFDTVEAAVEMAVDTARKASQSGFEASVMMLYGKQMKTLWPKMDNSPAPGEAV
jgi:hypothetical protein